MENKETIEYTHQELATKRRQLAQEYNEKQKEMAEIKKFKAIEVIRISSEQDVSGKQAERIFATTEKGQKEIEIEYYSKGLLELMRSIKSEIDIKNAEAYNQY